MTLPATTSGRFRRRFAVLALAAPVLVAGCASEGPLKPPTLRLPAAVRGLSAERAGPAVELSWTNPTRTTDGVSLAGKHGAGNLSAEICRAESFASPTNCSPNVLLPVVAGTPTTFHDTLPAALQTGSARVLHYRVRILNGDRKGAAFTAVVSLAGDAPAAVRGLTAFPVAGGIALRWQPGAGPLDRTLLRVTRGEAAAAVSGSAPESTPATGPEKPATTLMALEAGPHDPGGALDAGGHAGMKQVYTVYRARTLHIGTEDLTARSESATVTVAASALAPPPAPPTGLEAVSNTLGAAPAIDLVWQASTEAGVGGYLIFRTEPGTPAVQLTATPVRGFSYSDASARVGAVYRYSVAAVSTDGRAGARSAEIPASIPQP